jgi:hypothetical protein
MIFVTDSCIIQGLRMLSVVSSLKLVGFPRGIHELKRTPYVGTVLFYACACPAVLLSGLPGESLLILLLLLTPFFLGWSVAANMLSRENYRCLINHTIVRSVSRDTLTCAVFIRSYLISSPFLFLGVSTCLLNALSSTQPETGHLLFFCLTLIGLLTDLFLFLARIQTTCLIINIWSSILVWLLPLLPWLLFSQAWEGSKFFSYMLIPLCLSLDGTVTDYQLAIKDTGGALIILKNVILTVAIMLSGSWYYNKKDLATL